MSTTVRNLQAESLFKEWNVPFRLREDLTIESIRRESSAQVRDIAHIAIPENVDAYALQMRSGAQFPPVIIWQGVLIDGNTRLAAAQQNGLATFPAYDIEVPSIKMARHLAASINNTGAQRLSPAEARAEALSMMDDNFTDAQIARALGVTAESARQWRRMAEVDTRAERTGVTEAAAALGKQMRLQVAQVTHDEPFADLVSAIATTRPPAAEVKQLVSAIKDAPSDEAARGMIAAARQEWVPVGPQPAQVQRNKSAQLARMHIGALLKIDPVQVIDPGKLAEDRERWQALADVAARVLALMQAEPAA